MLAQQGFELEYGREETAKLERGRTGRNGVMRPSVAGHCWTWTSRREFDRFLESSPEF